MRQGYFGIGIENAKTSANIGTLWRSASIFGAAFLFTIGRRCKRQWSDTRTAWRDLPMYNHDTFDAFYQAMPYDCLLVGVEMEAKATPIKNYVHPARAVYLLGAEDQGLTPTALARCHHLIALPGDESMNVAVAGSLVMFDRHTKRSA